MHEKRTNFCRLPNFWAISSSWSSLLRTCGESWKCSALSPAGPSADVWNVSYRVAVRSECRHKVELIDNDLDKPARIVQQILPSKEDTLSNWASVEERRSRTLCTSYAHKRHTKQRILAGIYTGRFYSAMNTETSEFSSSLRNSSCNQKCLIFLKFYS